PVIITTRTASSLASASSAPCSSASRSAERALYWRGRFRVRRATPWRTSRLRAASASPSPGPVARSFIGFLLARPMSDYAPGGAIRLARRARAAVAFAHGTQGNPALTRDGEAGTFRVSMTGDTILETRGLTKEFKGFVAVDDVNLRVRRGAIHALIGPNGAGKTTTFNLLTKFLVPTAGTILFKGQDITRERPADVARRGVIRSFQISAVFPNL